MNWRDAVKSIKVGDVVEVEHKKLNLTELTGATRFKVTWKIGRMIIEIIPIEPTVSYKSTATTASTREHQICIVMSEENTKSIRRV